tara:strand:- start:8901 stop:9113 length:213 start_codon:yes stop_codon:yes gene_type:complete
MPSNPILGDDGYNVEGNSLDRFSLLKLVNKMKNIINNNIAANIPFLLIPNIGYVNKHAIKMDAIKGLKFG